MYISDADMLVHHIIIDDGIINISNFQIWSF